ncbi:unnamed protein product [Caenorhabditis auriculariae]|uniref:Cationic amino acid transporter C-terminal domain-containing protein n=1 Tax=Caenorhabditis auriculariae TaxID=2777116 RepID=A0A8S1HAQ2_9PELO|nr:unnamed protein product [Caenorhabditis auriculariae]
MGAKTFYHALFRKKHFDEDSSLASKLKRCLSVFDIMFIAIGHMIGAGIYMLAGKVAKDEAGPGIILSFTFAGVAALLSAFSYAEFGARYPRAGSAYTYTYVGVGELWAFVIGWTVPLEYMIGNAAVARAWSSYFDKLFGYPVRNFTLNTVGHLSTNSEFFSDYPDFLAFILLILVAIAVSIGSKASANLNTGFVCLNVLVLLFVIVSGLRYADFSLWSGTDENGRSKFLPYGVSGALAGASNCFFAYIGFEALATAGEEAKNPRRTIPIATFSSLAIITVLYILMGSTLTLMIPYYQIDVGAAYASAFEMKGAKVAGTIMSIGALAGMINNLITGSFALPRGVYAMADDGLIFSFFAKINSVTKTPLNATIVFTFLNALLALVFDLEALVEFLSIGTLLAYSMVTACVLILRYQSAPINGNEQQHDNGGTLRSWVPFRKFWEDKPAGLSIKFAVVTLIFGYVWIALAVRLGLLNTPWGIIMVSIGAVISLLMFLFILGHQQNTLSTYFKVPLVPFIPCIGLLINVFMMVYLNYLTWIRLFIWLAVGVLIYFGYGIRHSKEARRGVFSVDIPQPRNTKEKSRRYIGRWAELAPANGHIRGKNIVAFLLSFNFNSRASLRSPFFVLFPCLFHGFSAVDGTI